MKLLWCDNCHDIIALRLEEWRNCICGKIGGQYNYDGVTATIGGEGRVFGVANPFLSVGWMIKTEEEKKELRDKYYPEGKGSDCWWGSYSGDVQLFFILNPKGPKLKITSIQKDNSIEIRVKDRRKYWIDGKTRMKVVTLPNYEGIRLTKKAL
jgi:hypothetical protein